MIKYSYKKLVACSLAAGMLFSFSSCGISEPGEKMESYVTLKVKLPEKSTENNLEETTSRAGTPEPGEPDESKITTLKFFVYKASPLELESYQSITLDDSGNSSDPMWDSTNKALRITVTPGPKQIYCIANWVDGGSGMTAVTDATIANPTALQNVVRGHENLTLNVPLVMTGTKTATINAADQDISIELVRQTAKVEFLFKLHQNMADMNASIIIQGIKFRSLPKNSYLFDRSASPNAADVWHQSTYAGGSMVNPLTTTAVKYTPRYFVPEHYAGATTITQMYIQALYNGQTTYYRIDMCTPASNPQPTHQPYTVERNHTYRYTITVQGIGEAVESTLHLTNRSAGDPGLLNISYELEVE